MPRWSWLEWTLVAQTAMPAVLFIPGTTPIRTLTRVAIFAIALLAWAAVALTGRRAPGRPFPAVPWLAAAAAWLVLSIFNPTTNSLAAGVGQAALVIAIMSPAFWAGGALGDVRQLGRLMALLFLCNVASALVGIGQFYRPETFNPPAIPILSAIAGAEVGLSFTTDDGRQILRLCGLSDTPGGATAAGAMTCLAGLCWMLRPGRPRRRLACLALALAGVFVMYLSQVRATMITLVLSLAALVGLLALRRDYKRATQLAVGGALAFAAALAWVFVSAGEGTVRRFTSLLEYDPMDLYYRNRGHYLQAAFETLLVDHPLGAGLGRWGQIFAYFGDHSASVDRGMIWVELQFSAWIVDGGVPLMVAYVGAIAAALLDAVRILRTSRDEEVGFWAAVVAALGLFVALNCFGNCPFIGGIGLQFWMLFAALHAADQRARLEAARAAAARRGAAA